MWADVGRFERAELGPLAYAFPERFILLAEAVPPRIVGRARLSFAGRRSSPSFAVDLG